MPQQTHDKQLTKYGVRTNVILGLQSEKGSRSASGGQTARYVLIDTHLRKEVGSANSLEKIARIASESDKVKYNKDLARLRAHYDGISKIVGTAIQSAIKTVKGN